MMGVGLSRLKILGDLVQFLGLCFRAKTSLAAENLLLRKQLAFYQERKVKPRRADGRTRVTLMLVPGQKFVHVTERAGCATETRDVRVADSHFARTALADRGWCLTRG